MTGALAGSETCGAPGHWLGAPTFFRETCLGSEGTVNPATASSWVRWIAIALLFVGLVRAGALLLHSPLIGMANNYDMIRVQGCIDAYPIREDSIPAWANSWQAPLPRYEFRDDTHPGCFFTSEAIFAFVALPLMKWQAERSDDGGFSLRTVGVVKYIFFASLAGWLTARLFRQRRWKAALVHSVAFAGVLADPGVMIYLNAFYAESAAVYFTYAAVALVVAANANERPAKPYVTLLMLTVALACASKIQHFALGLFILACMIAAQRFGRQMHRSVLAAVAIGALIGLASQLWQLRAEHTVSMRSANLTNTVLGTVLMSADNPQKTAEHMGLPARCGDHAGKTWFTPGVQDAHPCPELLELSRTRFLSLAAQEPGVVLNVFAGGMMKARPWITSDFGLVAGEDQGKLPRWMFTLSDGLNALGPAAFALFLLAPSLLALIGWVLRVPVGQQLGFVLLACGLYPPIALTVVVFGDGFADVAKQFHLGTAAALTFWAVALMALVGVLIAHHSRRSPEL